MDDKLTPRQNEIISEALAQISVTLVEQGREGELPERIKTIRGALVNELKAVSGESDLVTAKTVLEAARHDLVSLNGLVVADGAAPEQTFSIDNRKTIALIDEFLAGPSRRDKSVG